MPEFQRIVDAHKDQCYILWSVIHNPSKHATWIRFSLGPVPPHRSQGYIHGHYSEQLSEAEGGVVQQIFPTILQKDYYFTFFYC